MLNERKIRLMTQLAIYEKNGGKEDIKLSKYYKGDYSRFQAWKTAVAITIGYILLLAVAAVYKLEYLIDEAFEGRITFRHTGLSPIDDRYSSERKRKLRSA